MLAYPFGHASWITQNIAIPESDYSITICRNHGIALLIIGGWNGYEAAFKMHNERANVPSCKIPIVCMPASINNNLPGSEFSIGADTALGCCDAGRGNA